jgi:hypothetical protein
MITTTKIFPIGKMKGFATIQQGQKRPRNNRVGSLLKRFVAHVKKERSDACGRGDVDNRKHSLQLWMRQRKSFKRDRIFDTSYHSVISLQHHQMPEILKVSPMCTSCEVTLISSVADGPGTHQITVTHDGRPELDNSYHLVLNPHRSSRSNHYDDEIGSNAVTHDSTTDLSCSSGLNGNTTTTMATAPTTPQSYVTGRDNNEETIIFGDNIDDLRDNIDDLHFREMYDVTTRKETIFHKSLFVASDTENDSDGDDDNDAMDLEFWENIQTWRNERPSVVEDVCYGYVSELQKQKDLLNTTCDTALYEDEDDESYDSYRDEDLPIEITVQF